jgi:hypothetical protein
LRFTDLLKATVLLCAGCATLLAGLTIIGATRESQPSVVYFAVAWWAVAAGIGVWVGRRNETTPPIARLLATARAQASLPEIRPGLALVNRLWPLLVSTIGAGVLAFVAPQIPGVAAGFAIIWALSWRRQEQAVLAIEERDAVRFYVDKTSPASPIQLVRTPGWGGNWLKRG